MSSEGQRSGRGRVAALIPVLAPLAIGAATAYAVLDGKWKHVLAGGAGLAFLAVGLAHPRIPLWAWLLIAPVAGKYGTVSLPVGLPDITFARVAIALVVIALLLRFVLQGRRFRRAGPLEWAILVLVVIMTLDLFWRAENLTSEALQNFDEWGIPILLYFCARHLLTRRSDVKYAAYALLLVGCYLGLHGSYQFWRFSAPSPDAVIVQVERIEGARVNEDFGSEGRSLGPFGSPVEYGSVGAVSFAAAFVLLLRRVGDLSRLFPLMALAASAVAVVLSATRSAWLGAVVAIAIIAALDRERRAVIIASFGSVAVLTIAIILVVLPRGDIYRERALSMDPINARAMMYKIGFTLAARHPITGYGRGTPALRAASQEADAMGGYEAEIAAGQFHNTFLMTLVEWGIFGLAAYVAVLALLFQVGFAVRRENALERGFLFHFAGLYIAAGAVFVVQNLLVDTPSFMYLNGLVFMLAGLLQAQRDHALSTSPEPSIIAAPNRGAVPA